MVVKNLLHLYNIDDEKYRKFRDLCHYTSKYIGAAHRICNIR